MQRAMSIHLSEHATSAGYPCFNVSMPRYAWLEYEDGMWHFLTNLFANPGDSPRRWHNENAALDELAREGWSVIAPYPDLGSGLVPSHDKITGYGLMWIED
jgi:hypothetical protein